MKEWAKEFYLGKDWQELRDSYLKTQHYICERCGEPAKIAHHKVYLTKRNINDTNISLNPDNLEALCQDCHNKEHHANEKAIAGRYMFNAAGEIIFLENKSAESKNAIPPI